MTKEKLWQRSKQKIRFQNDDMDFYFAWILSQRRRFGIGECFYAASQIKDGDPESWYAAWTAIAQRVESQATLALEKGHCVRAREGYLRAFTYYQSAAIFIRPRGSRGRDAWQKAQWCFRQAAAQFSLPIEPIQIPYRRQGVQRHQDGCRASALGDDLAGAALFDGTHDFRSAL